MFGVLSHAGGVPSPSLSWPCPILAHRRSLFPPFRVGGRGHGFLTWAKIGGMCVVWVGCCVRNIII